MSKAPTLLVAGSLRLGANSEVSDEVPIKYIILWIKKHMSEFGGLTTNLADRILIVRSETGSGKSTVLPVEVFRILRDKQTPAGRKYQGAGVICTQPRILTAITLATDVSSRPWNPDMVLGETVGFQTGAISNMPASGLIYATAGVLAVQLRNLDDDELMGKYKFILIDEAHERSLDIDMTLMLLRNFFLRNIGNKKLPFLLLTSATFNTKRYADYFGVSFENIIEVTGRSYPIKIHWPDHGSNNYLTDAVLTALKIHNENLDDPPEQADILIFMPGAHETTTVANGLNAAAKANTKNPFIVLTINRKVVTSQSKDFYLIFEKPELLPLVDGVKIKRRIIVSTVVAETGITIDTLKYVIDCGWSREREVYQPWAIEGIITRPAPKSRIKQRQGRAGRLFPGDFYPLYMQNVFNALEDQQLPEIISTGVSDIYLALVCEQQRQKLRIGKVPEFRLEDISLLDPPAPEALLIAQLVAISLGFISVRSQLPTKWPPTQLETIGFVEDPSKISRGYGLTPFGFIGAMFSRTNMEGVRILLSGYLWNVAASDLITAVAMFGTPVTDLLAYRGHKKKGATPSSLPAGAEALRASLPQFLVQKIYGSGNDITPPTEHEAFFYRAKLLIADDFIEAILMFDAFVHKLDTSEDVASTSKWCASVELNFDALVEVARKREFIIEDMITAGLDPFRLSDRRIAALPIEEFTAGLRSIKQCLFEGLRCNLLKYDPEKLSYITSQGLKVKCPALFTDATASKLKALHITTGPVDALRPKWIITDKLRLLPVAKHAGESDAQLLYFSNTTLVSVLDGYVNPDPDFITARSF